MDSIDFQARNLAQALDFLLHILLNICMKFEIITKSMILLSFTPIRKKFILYKLFNILVFEVFRLI